MINVLNTPIQGVSDMISRAEYLCKYGDDITQHFESLVDNAIQADGFTGSVPDIVFNYLFDKSIKEFITTVNEDQHVWLLDKHQRSPTNDNFNFRDCVTLEYRSMFAQDSDIRTLLDFTAESIQIADDFCSSVEEFFRSDNFLEQKRKYDERKHNENRVKKLKEDINYKHTLINDYILKIQDLRMEIIRCKQLLKRTENISSVIDSIKRIDGINSVSFSDDTNIVTLVLDELSFSNHVIGECSVCSGKGYVYGDDDSQVDCTYCDGSGENDGSEFHLTVEDPTIMIALDDDLAIGDGCITVLDGCLPHSDYSGESLCLGGFTEDVANAIRDNDLFALSAHLVCWASRYDSDDAYQELEEMNDRIIEVDVVGEWL